MIQISRKLELRLHRLRLNKRPCIKRMGSGRLDHSPRVFVPSNVSLNHFSLKKTEIDVVKISSFVSGSDESSFERWRASIKRERSPSLSSSLKAFVIVHEYLGY